MGSLIETKVLKGFRDFLPETELARRTLIARVEATFRLYGFVPIDTPALEYAAILLGKSGGETEKQIYRFTDNGGRDVALRFDLTVPLARFFAEHRAELSLPFKRYHIAKVWRGENTQRGRYREFTQCDFDIVGDAHPAADFEILLLMHDVINATGAGTATIRINHRGFFNRFLTRHVKPESIPEILHIVDKAAKITRNELATQLETVAGQDSTEMILRFIETKGTFEETLERLAELSGGHSPESLWLKQIQQLMLETGTESFFVLDPSITRGLDYYTGIVFESFLDSAPSIGSVCSGGRYDNLVSLYSKDPVSGVGASLGLDRLMAALEDKPGQGSATVAIVYEHQEDLARAEKTAKNLRSAGISCELFWEVLKLNRQYILAEKKGIRFVLRLGTESYTIRNLEKRSDQSGLSFEEILTFVKDSGQQ